MIDTPDINSGIPATTNAQSETDTAELHQRLVKNSRDAVISLRSEVINPSQDERTTGRRRFLKKPQLPVESPNQPLTPELAPIEPPTISDIPENELTEITAVSTPSTTKAEPQTDAKINTQVGAMNRLFEIKPDPKETPEGLPVAEAEVPNAEAEDLTTETESVIEAGPFSGPAPTIDQTIQLAQTAAKEAFAANPEKEPSMLQQAWKHIRHQNISPESINQPISTT